MKSQKNPAQKFLLKTFSLVAIFGIIFSFGFSSKNASAQYNGSPTVSTQNATSITENSAFLNGYISGNSLPTAWFEWGTSPSSLYNNTSQNTYGSYSSNYNAYLSGLSANTTYYFRAVARNSYDTVRGNILSFTTGYYNQNYPPYQNGYLNATTNTATAIHSTSAQLNGMISNQTGLEANAWFEWGTNQNLNNRTDTVSVGNIQSVIHQNTLSGLTPGTTYYYRLIVETYSGSNPRSVGSTLYFTTAPAPYSPPITIVTPDPVYTYTQPVYTSPTYVYTNSGYNNNVNYTTTSAYNRPTTVYTVADNNNLGMTKTQANMVLVINGSADPIGAGEQREYNVIWRNNNTRSLSRGTLQIVLPPSLALVSASGGTFNAADNSLNLDLGTLSAGEQGQLTFVGQTSPNLSSNEQVSIKATLVYTAGVREGVTTTRTESINAPAYTSPTASSAGLSASALSSGYLPNNLFGWAILIVLLFILLILCMYIYTRMYPKKQVIVVDHPPMGSSTTTTTTEHTTTERH
jgi:hypothetical protein